MPTGPESWICPECEQGKHHACNGTAWDFDADELVPCGCSHHPRRSQAMKQVDVFPHENGEGWDVHARGFDTQTEAIDVARVMSRILGGELVIHGEDGQIRAKDSHGHDSPEIPG